MMAGVSNEATITATISIQFSLSEVFMPSTVHCCLTSLKNPNTGETEEILVECTETRDQPKNKERALARLRTYIYDKEHQKYIDDIASRRKTMVSTGDRSAKIRTYNYPQGRITDHRIGYTIYNLAAFMDGNIQDCIDHLIVAENAERLKEAEL